MNEIHPAPLEFSAEALTTDPILHFFHYAHLPINLQSASAPFCGLALHIITTLPRNAERTVALRKLLEAKDAAVRANISNPKAGAVASANEGMPPFLTRLLAEHSELEDKLIKLRNFVGSPAFVELDEANRSLLIRQEEQMTDYRETLHTRIEIARAQLSDERVAEIGEAVEVGGHDIDRDGPVSFSG